MDYTGAMRNATGRTIINPLIPEPMSQGTRMRAIGYEYVIFESPLNMLCDNPTNYMNENECTEFIAQVPTRLGQTVTLNGEIAKYVSIAREKGTIVCGLDDQLGCAYARTGSVIFSEAEVS